MTDRFVSIQGIQTPRFFYGTAWKEDQTQPLTELAIEQGFRGVDTANQRKHYFEEGVGRAIASAIAKGSVAREDLFLQTKFTFRRGQDQRLPYDPNSPVSDQVEQSLVSSLQHLQTEWIDSFLLHGPTGSSGLTHDDWAAWQAMESLHDNGKARMLGVSNVNLEQLRRLCHGARILPNFVQNRCFATTGWDRHVREFCTGAGIVYQGFSLLTANHSFVNSPKLIQIANHHQRTPAQIIFRFALEVGMIPLTGTTTAQHLQEDLQVFEFCLAPEEKATIENIALG